MSQDFDSSVNFFFDLPHKYYLLTMKFSTAFLLLANATAFSPSVSFNRHATPLQMSTEASAETKVRTTISLSNENPFDGHDKLILIIS
jgi:hypothetical protein